MSEDLTPMEPGAPERFAIFYAEQTDCEWLRNRLVACLGLTAEGLLEAAHLIRALEAKGDDLAGLRIGLINHLRRVATGQLLPEVLVRFGGKPSLITIIGGLPLSDQRRLAQGEFVPLIVYGENGVRTKRMADPINLTPRQVAQVFTRDHIRTDAEQALVLDDRREQTVASVLSVGLLSIDKDRGGVVIGRKFIPLADLVAAVKALQS